MTVSGGKLRAASTSEIADLAARENTSRDLTRLPGLGKEGLEALLGDGGPPGGPRAGLLITCTCGHLFLDELPGR